MLSSLKIGVLASGSGTNLQAIIDAMKEGRVHADLRVVICNRPQAFALERAQKANISSIVVSHRNFATREDFEKELVQHLRQYDVELVVLAGFMRVLTPHFLRAFPARVINIHPALLPSFPGTNALKQALEYGVKMTGCTVHFVDEGTDTGPIIAQAAVPVFDGDDEESLHQRVLEQEHRIYPWVIEQFAQGRIQCEHRRVKIQD